MNRFVRVGFLGRRLKDTAAGLTFNPIYTCFDLPRAFLLAIERDGADGPMGWVTVHKWFEL